MYMWTMWPSICWVNNIFPFLAISHAFDGLLMGIIYKYWFDS